MMCDKLISEIHLLCVLIHQPQLNSRLPKGIHLGRAKHLCHLQVPLIPRNSKPLTECIVDCPAKPPLLDQPNRIPQLVLRVHLPHLLRRQLHNHIELLLEEVVDLQAGTAPHEVVLFVGVLDLVFEVGYHEFRGVVLGFGEGAGGQREHDGAVLEGLHCGVEGAQLVVLLDQLEVMEHIVITMNVSETTH